MPHIYSLIMSDICHAKREVWLLKMILSGFFFLVKLDFKGLFIAIFEIGLSKFLLITIKS